jgi:hypothetical protein
MVQDLLREITLGYYFFIPWTSFLAIYEVKIFLLVDHLHYLETILL